jgi:hypothetical protein
MTGSENRGNHKLTFRFTPGRKSDSPARLLAERRGIRISDDAVMDAERAAIESRRARKRGDRDRTKCELTGVALSGGGIRSGSVALGALQGIEVAMQLDGSGGIDGIDYLSSVSGGGYVGCSLTNAMERAGGAFPFTEPKTYADTAAVRHIRDFSNYLIPRGGTDIVTAVAIVLRGLVANLIIVLPIIVGLAWLTVVAHPTVKSLTQPTVFQWDVGAWARHVLPQSTKFWSLPGFWLTLVILGITVAFLAIWVFIKSIQASQTVQTVSSEWRDAANSPELQGLLPRFSKILFFAALIAAVVEAQPFVLSLALNKSDGCVAAFVSSTYDQCLASLTSGWLSNISINSSVVALIGSVIALFSKYLGDVAAVAGTKSTMTWWLRKVLARAAIWFAAIVVPLYLWHVYLELSAAAICSGDHECDGSKFGGLINLVGKSDIVRFYLAIAVVGLALSIFVNPNVTSLYRLYRDRLARHFCLILTRTTVTHTTTCGQ